MSAVRHCASRAALVAGAASTPRSAQVGPHKTTTSAPKMSAAPKTEETTQRLEASDSGGAGEETTGAADMDFNIARV